MRDVLARIAILAPPPDTESASVPGPLTEREREALRLRAQRVRAESRRLRERSAEVSGRVRRAQRLWEDRVLAVTEN
jgi:hypothetical protein